MLYLSRITDATVDAFASCGFNIRMRKYAQCGPRLSLHGLDLMIIDMGYYRLLSIGCNM